MAAGFLDARPSGNSYGVRSRRRLVQCESSRIDLQQTMVLASDFCASLSSSAMQRLMRKEVLLSHMRTKVQGQPVESALQARHHCCPVVSESLLVHTHVAVHTRAQAHGKVGRAASSLDIPAAHHWLGLLSQSGALPLHLLLSH